MIFEYKPQNVCSRLMIFNISDDDIIQEVTIVGGCPGNALAVSYLCKGKHIDEVIATLKGIPCKTKKTSCPDQIAVALEEYKKNKNK
ncbi:MAG: TIGR03905 family TSCPD domain-containing protein [Clostridia bacterium]